MGALKTLWNGVKLPEPQAPTRMPSQADRMAETETQRRSAAERAKTQGRASTNLRSGDYGNDVLGN